MKQAKLTTVVLLPLLCLCLSGPAGCRAADSPAPARNPPSPPGATARAQVSEVHVTSLAGTWYSADAATLRANVEAVLRAVPDSITVDARDLLALIVPHAGYRYSGKTAGYGYKILKARRPKRIVLIGPPTTQCSTVSPWAGTLHIKPHWAKFPLTKSLSKD